MKTKDTSRGYWYNVWQRFRVRRDGRLAIRGLQGFLLIAFLSPFLANERPFYAKVDGHSFFPLFQGFLVDAGLSSWNERLIPAEDWLDKTYDKVLFTFIPYSPSSIDHKNLGARGPFERQRVESWRYWHWMGTDKAGRDVAAGMLHGALLALWVGFIAVSVALVLGLTFGGLAGYFGDTGFVLNRTTLFIYVFFLPLSLFYAAYLPGNDEDSGWFGLLINFIGLVIGPLVVAYLLAAICSRLFPHLKKITFPLDTLLMRFLEIVDAIPSIILVLALIATLQQPSVTYMMAIVGIITSASLARFVRAEFLKVRKQTYMEAGRALGFNHIRLIFRHALPNAVGPLLVLLSFSVAAAITTESSLSLLGVGAADKVTWGTILGQLRGQQEIEWWLAIFPGIAIFFTVITFKSLGEGLSEALGEK